MLENTAISSVFMLWVVLGGGDHVYIYIYIGYNIGDNIGIYIGFRVEGLNSLKRGVYRGSYSLLISLEWRNRKEHENYCNGFKDPFLHS